MLKYIENINEYSIYKDIELRNFLINLESSYNIVDEIDFFKNLVNFSSNASISYHNWFKYREGYSHLLVKELMEREQLDTSEFIIDPFVGSGTTMVEAGLLGYQSLGIDVNPLSTFISNVKADVYTDKDVENLSYHLDKISILETGTIDLDNYEDIRNYFNDNNLSDLLIIKKYIDQIKEEKVKDILLTGFISIVEECSDRKRDGNGLKKQLSRVDNVISFFHFKMLSIYSDLKNERIKDCAKGKAVTDSSENLKDIVDLYSKEINKTPGAIIFSPPYANSFDYFESYKMELKLGGFIEDSSDLKKLRNSAIRSFVNNSQNPIAESKYIDALAKEIEDAIPEKELLTGRRDSRTRKVPQMIRGYFNDMSMVIEQCGLSLSKGKKMYIVVDQSSYLGKIVPTDLLLGYLGEQCGFKVDQIILCRKARTSGQQIQRFPYLAESLRESIVVLEKQ